MEVGAFAIAVVISLIQALLGDVAVEQRFGGVSDGRN